MLNEVRLIKLVNGDLILSEIFSSPPEHNHDFTYTLVNPVKVVVIPNKIDPATPQIGFAPWAQFTGDSRFVVDRIHVLTTMEPVEQMRNQYQTLFSPIIQPPAGLILPVALGK